MTGPAPSMDFEETAYRAIIRRILDNQYRPGDILLETELAGQLNLSRTPVSHALGRLVAEGFLEKRRKKGCVVPALNPEDARRVFTARLVIECELAALAAARATTADIEGLRAVLRQEEEGVTAGDREAYASSNEAFHFGIARAAGNAYLERYLRHSFWHSSLYVFFFEPFYQRRGERLPAQHTPQQHRAILEAIAARDQAGAREAMRHHVSRTYESLFAQKTRLG